MFIAFFIAFNSSAFGQKSSLFGTWAALKSSNGGLTNILEFRNNGIAIQASVVMLEYNYKIEGETLTLTPSLNDDELLIKKYKIKLKKYECRLICEDGASVFLSRKDRIDTQKKPGIVGKWLFQHNSGATGYYIFKQDNFLLLRIPMPGATISQYHIRDNFIEFSRKNLSKSIVKYKIDSNGFLVLITLPDNQKWEYQKITESAPKISVK